MSLALAPDVRFGSPHPSGVELLCEGCAEPPPPPRDMACPICCQQETTQHAVAGCKYISVAAHVAALCLGPAHTEEGPVTDPTVILWDRPELSLTPPPPLGIALWSVVRGAWAQWCLHKFNTRLPPPYVGPVTGNLGEGTGRMGRAPHPDPAQRGGATPDPCPEIPQGYGIPAAPQSGCVLHVIPTQAVRAGPQTEKEISACRGVGSQI